MSPKPKPLVTKRVCDICGLDWDAHGDKPTERTCIELLRSELMLRPAYVPWGPWTHPVPEFVIPGGNVWASTDRFTGDWPTETEETGHGWNDE